jgi:hypothetical protein
MPVASEKVRKKRFSGYVSPSPYSGWIRKGKIGISVTGNVSCKYTGHTGGSPENSVAYLCGGGSIPAIHLYFASLKNYLSSKKFPQLFSYFEKKPYICRAFGNK